MPVRKYSDDINEYRIMSGCYIATTRFNNDKRYCEKIGKNMYNCEQPVSQYISKKIDVYVLELNNETNRIVGIGLIRNNPIYKKYKIHSVEKYNEFSYIGKEGIERCELTPKEEEIMRVFDILCFKGKRHMKRLKGIKCFPLDMLYNSKDILDLVIYPWNTLAIKG